jgi:hypothetical protein
MESILSTTFISGASCSYILGWFSIHWLMYQPFLLFHSKLLDQPEYSPKYFGSLAFISDTPISPFMLPKALPPQYYTLTQIIW